jgi:outer membrane protein assembly factor BamB
MTSGDGQEGPSSVDGGQAAGSVPRGGKGRRRVPPRWMWLAMAAGALAVAVLYHTEAIGDRAAVNVVTEVLALVACLTLLVWFSFFSGYRRRSRMNALGLSVAGVAAFFAAFRVDHVSGELVPSFSWRWSRKPDERLEAPSADDRPATAKMVDLSAGAEHDFPQFLGPDRSAAVPNVKLARDWIAQPPQLVWRHKIGAGWSAFAVVHGHAVTLEQRGELEIVACYNLETGEVEWANSIEARYETVPGGVGPRSTPTIDERLVYTLGATGRLQCLDGATGSCRWEKDLLQEYHISAEQEAAGLAYGRSNSPLVVDDLVIVPAGGPSGGPYVSLVACNKKTGAVVWEGGNRQISYSSPALATLGGVRQVLIVNEDTASGHDVKTGRVLWEHPWPGNSSRNASVSQAVPVPPDCVFLSKAYGNGAALIKLLPGDDGLFTTQVVWENARVMKTKFTNVAVKDGFAYGLSDGVLECVDLSTGRTMWREGRYHQGQILRVGDLLLVLAESGEILLVELSPDHPNMVLGRFQALEGMTWNNIALSGPYLLVRNAGEAACYRLPLASR